MLTKKILKLALNVKQTAIDGLDIFEDGSFVVDVHPTKGAQCRCGICGRKATRYDQGTQRRLWRAGDFNFNKVFLRSNTYRVQCPEHGVVTMHVPWAAHKSRFTYDFEQTVAWLSLHCSKTVVSAFMRINWRTVGEIIGRIKERLDPDPTVRFNGLANIGVDETSYKKGHKYITVVVNHDTGKVIWVHDGHGKSIFSKFFEQLTQEQRASIRLVSGDGARWIQECIDKYCPEATRCVDPFHVVSWASDALDDVRRQAWNDARKASAADPKPKRGRPSKGSSPKPRKASTIKNMRFALWKAADKLTSNQQAQIELLAKSDNRLYRAYLLKEELRMVFQQDTVDEAMDLLDHWIKWAQHCRIKVFVDLQRKIRRHYDAIRAALEHKLSNARLEAVNNKVKLTVRMAYGFRNIENLIAMVMLRCSDIEVMLPWNQRAWPFRSPSP